MSATMTAAQAARQSARHTDGRYAETRLAEGPDLALDDELDDEEGLGQVLCPLCYTPIDYCPGHAEWNATEPVLVEQLEPGDQVWGIGTVTAIATLEGGTVELTGDGGVLLARPGSTLQALPADLD